MFETMYPLAVQHWVTKSEILYSLCSTRPISQYITSRHCHSPPTLKPVQQTWTVEQLTSLTKSLLLWVRLSLCTYFQMLMPVTGTNQEKLNDLFLANPCLKQFEWKGVACHSKCPLKPPGPAHSKPTVVIEGEPTTAEFNGETMDASAGLALKDSRVNPQN